ncbi:MAG TPA: excinuclease ABC subunit UvrA [bacterium]|nr:excinuclease ABC subunit UvrA [bacterium]
MSRSISLKGVRHHNLKNFDLEIPHEKLVVVTGVSGSGKTSLAFDTIYAEGQRRYVESLSSYARQFLELSEKPDADHIEGLSPSIAIQQRGINASPRSIVGTTTEIYDYLRLLFARAGTVHCHECGKVITKTPASHILETVLNMTGKKILILSPLISARKGTYEKLFEDLHKEGYVRIIIDETEFRLDEPIPSLDKFKKHTINLVVDRLVIKPDIDTSRVRASIETALSKGSGKVIIKDLEGGEKLFSEHFACPYCDIYYDEIEPRSFSFNNPAGACPDCNGLGFKMHMDVNKILVSPEKVFYRAIPSIQAFTRVMITQVIEYYKEDPKLPFNELSKKVTDAILYGTKEEINFSVRTTNMRHKFKRPFEGVINMLERRYRETESEMIRTELSALLAEGVCPTCNGMRLSKKALSVKIAGYNIFELGEMPVRVLFNSFSDREFFKFSNFQWEIAEKMVREITLRLSFLFKVGLGYLTLNRKTATLSGGESQRIHLATQIGSALTGVTYVLDEPSIGLHPDDTDKLITILKNLRDQGNNVIVVEHDRDMMESADFLIDLGPGAGELGGELLFAGQTKDIAKVERSLTGQYLSGKKSIPVPKNRRTPEKWINLEGAKTNNLKNVSVDIPLNVFCSVTGVSGSGKSSLIMETLIPALRNKPANLKKIFGKSRIEELIEIDQSPIGRTPRSNPATYTGAFGPIRELFAKMPDSKARGYSPGRFSFNVKGGRCETCQGAGIIKIEMNFMPDTYVKCPDCGGKRFNEDTLEIKFKGYSIYDVLEMEVSVAVELFSPFPAIKRKLELLNNIGLGYIKLGQPAHTLSGGEAQRIKLSKELAKKRSDGSLYILDEPTTGLHFDDIKKLIKILNKLVEKGSTVLIIEHNLDIIKCSDYIIDIGPQGGDEGGKIVAVGTPEEVAKNKKSLTGKHLKTVL